MPSCETRMVTRTRRRCSDMARRTRDATKILKRVTGSDPELREMIAEENVNVRVARLIHDARVRAGLTQAELARRIGTKQPVIARLEDADYAGHSLTMLQRIASALDLQIDVKFVSTGVQT